MTVRVLFVCLGNICRSPMAEAIFQHLVDDAGLSDAIRVDSAGTSGWHIGEPAHRGTRAVLSQHGIPYDGRARQIVTADFDRFDYVLAMDGSNLSDLRKMMPAENTVVVERFLNFAGDTPTRDVPDPYYDGRFEDVYQLVRQGAQALLDTIRAEHEL